MTALNRTTLKTFFETGDIPTQVQFGDLIDSYLSLTDPAPQSILSNVSAQGSLELKSTFSVSGASTLAATTINGAFTVAGSANSSLTGNLSIIGPINPSGGIAGVTTNTNAKSGNIGEYIFSNITSPLNILSGNATDITSISLTAGDWNVWGTISDSPAVGTTRATVAGWISSTSATNPGAPNNGAFMAWQGSVIGSSGSICFPVGMIRLSLATTTTIYLSTILNFTGSTNAAVGFIGARRVQ